MQRPRVLKLGGSLLSLCDLPQRFRRWLEENPHPLSLVVVGGGDIIEAVRCLESRHAFDAQFIHWLCIDLLDSTARLAHHIFPEMTAVTSDSELRRFLQAPPSSVPTDSDGNSQASCEALALGIVHVSAFYQPIQNDLKLPEDWRTTSDSLAALLAYHTNAEILVLFKSLQPTVDLDTPSKLARAGIVDEAFPLAAQRISKFTIVNLCQND